jgi:hypothetical protein
MSSGGSDKGVHDNLFYAGLLFNNIEKINDIAVQKHNFPQQYFNSVVALYNTYNYYVFGGGDQEPDYLFINEVSSFEDKIEAQKTQLRPDKREAWAKEQYPILVADVYFKAIMKSLGRQGMLPKRKRSIEI